MTLTQLATVTATSTSVSISVSLSTLTSTITSTASPTQTCYPTGARAPYNIFLAATRPVARSRGTLAHNQPMSIPLLTSSHSKHSASLSPAAPSLLRLASHSLESPLTQAVPLSAKVPGTCFATRTRSGRSTPSDGSAGPTRSATDAMFTLPRVSARLFRLLPCKMETRRWGVVLLRPVLTPRSRGSVVGNRKAFVVKIFDPLQTPALVLNNLIGFHAHVNEFIAGEGASSTDS